jgi:hypothetical protein
MPKFVWKHTYHNDILPFKKYSKAHQLSQDGPHLTQQQINAREMREGAGKKDEQHDNTQTKVTTFVRGSKVPRETLLKHDLILEKRKKVDDPDRV